MDEETLMIEIDDIQVAYNSGFDRTALKLALIAIVQRLDKLVEIAQEQAGNANVAAGYARER